MLWTTLWTTFSLPRATASIKLKRDRTESPMLFVILTLWDWKWFSTANHIVRHTVNRSASILAFLLAQWLVNFTAVSTHYLLRYGTAFICSRLNSVPAMTSWRLLKPTRQSFNLSGQSDLVKFINLFLIKYIIDVNLKKLTSFFYVCRFKKNTLRAYVHRPFSSLRVWIKTDFSSVFLTRRCSSQRLLAWYRSSTKAIEWNVY